MTKKGYKYRAFKDFDRDLISLLNNQIYASLFSELNDPFEATFNDEITQFLKLLETIFKIDPSEAIETLNGIKKLKEKIGIYSLSESYSEDLLWAHYASSYKGFCLEYDIQKLKDKHLAPAKVNEFVLAYKEKPPILSYEDIGKNTLLQKLFATKSLKWKDEKEIRLLFDTNSFKDYHPSALTGVYFGTTFPERERQILINSLIDRDVKFYSIYRDENSYELKRILVHENQRNISKKINLNTFKILKTNHNHVVENFEVLYTDSNYDKTSLAYFFDSFRENYATKDSNIDLYNDESIMPLTDKYPLSDTEYLKVAKHFIATSNFETPNNFKMYPYQDSRYKEIINKQIK